MGIPEFKNSLATIEIQERTINKLKELDKKRLKDIILLHWMIDKGYNFNDHKKEINAFQEA